MDHLYLSLLLCALLLAGACAQRSDSHNQMSESNLFENNFGSRRSKPCFSGSCGPGEFKCSTTMQCIPDMLKCDGVPHCPDGSDESDCDNHEVCRDYYGLCELAINIMGCNGNVVGNCRKSCNVCSNDGRLNVPKTTKPPTATTPTMEPQTTEFQTTEFQTTEPTTTVFTNTETGTTEVPTTESPTTDSPTTKTSFPSASTPGHQVFNTECGLLPNMEPVSKRIVNGNEATAHEWPSVCSVHFNGYISVGHKCGGTLIKNNKGKFYVISAAHCFLEGDKKDFDIRCGIHNASKDVPSYEQRLEVEKILKHEKFEYPKRINGKIYASKYDIAIIEIKNQPNETEHVQAACLPSLDHQPNDPAVVVGWGLNQHNGVRPSDVLHELQVLIASNEDCENIYDDQGGSWILESDIQGSMCAGNTEVGKGFCGGDSGGPLYSRRNGRWTLVGVVSWTESCARPGYLDVYTDVFRSRDWIDSVINSD